MTANVLRRLIVFALLFALVTIAAIGLSGLIERALGFGTVLVADTAGLARALAFVLIAAPLAGVLWWWERRRLADSAERASLVWALYLAAMSLTSPVVAVSSAATAAASGIDGEWRPGAVASAIVWAGVWGWHQRMLRNPATAPTRLPALGTELSALYGLAVAAFGAATVIAVLVSEAATTVMPQLFDSRPWHLAVLQALVWGTAGVLVWWWHWIRARARTAPGAFAEVLLVIVVALSAAAALFGLGTVLHIVLRLLFDDDPVAQLIAPLGTATGAALVGAIVCVAHTRLLPGRGARAQGAARLAVSGVSLIGAASGFGVIVNALLASLDTTLVGGDPRALLLAGVSALIIGAPAWWLIWRSARPVTAEESGDIARRVYLVVVFGASAVVALVTLLLIGYRVFEVILGARGDAGAPGGLIERIRAPFGLLSATVLVFAYHFTVWRRDRVAAPPTAKPSRVERVVLVAGADSELLAARIREETGARVTVWHTVEDGAVGEETDAAAIITRLGEVTAQRALVVAEPGRATRVVPLSG